MKLRKLIAQLIIVAAMSASFALMPQGHALAAGECREEVAKFCPDAKGPKQELACLKAHKKELSPRCKRRVLKMLKAAKGAKLVQGQKIRLCLGVPLGPP